MPEYQILLLLLSAISFLGYRFNEKYKSSLFWPFLLISSVVIAYRLGDCKQESLMYVVNEVWQWSGLLVYTLVARNFDRWGVTKSREDNSEKDARKAVEAL